MIKTASKKSLCRFHAQELVLHLINRAAITSIFRQENRYSYYRNDPVKFFIWLACWRMFLLELYKEEEKEKRHLKNALYIRYEVWLVLSCWIVEL